MLLAIFIMQGLHDHQEGGSNEFYMDELEVLPPKIRSGD